MQMASIPEWTRSPWLRHGFSRRAGGVSHVYGHDELNLGYTPRDDPANVAANRQLWVAANGGGDLCTVRQVHGTDIHIVHGPGVAGDGDGLMTDRAGLLLGILTADCVPVLLADTRRHAVAALHAGWRGTFGRIAELGVARMEREFGSVPEDLIAAVGPAIGPCCYAICDELAQSFREEFSYGTEFLHTSNQAHLDLPGLNERQLLQAGVGHVSVVRQCTACARLDGRRSYFSHRADAGVTGRMMSIIGLDPMPT